MESEVFFFWGGGGLEFKVEYSEASALQLALYAVLYKSPLWSMHERGPRTQQPLALTITSHIMCAKVVLQARAHHHPTSRQCLATILRLPIAVVFFYRARHRPVRRQQNRARHHGWSQERGELICIAHALARLAIALLALHGETRVSLAGRDDLVGVFDAVDPVAEGEAGTFNVEGTS